MDIINQMMLLLDTAMCRKLLTAAEYRQISSLLQAAQGREWLGEMSRRTSNV